MFKVQYANDKELIVEVLNNVYDNEYKIHAMCMTGLDFEKSNLNFILKDEDSYLFMHENKPLALFGLRVGEFPVMWAMPRKDMTSKENVAYLRYGRKIILEWYNQFGTIYAPLHEDWEEARRIVFFLGFKETVDGIAVFNGGK